MPLLPTIERLGYRFLSIGARSGAEQSPAHFWKYSALKFLFRQLGLPWWSDRQVEVTISWSIKKNLFPLGIVCFMSSTAALTLKNVLSADASDASSIAHITTDLCFVLSFILSSFKVSLALTMKTQIMELLEYSESILVFGGALESSRAYKISRLYITLLYCTAVCWLSYTVINGKLPINVHLPFANNTAFGFYLSFGILSIAAYLTVICHSFLDSLFTIVSGSVCDRVSRLKNILAGIGTQSQFQDVYGNFSLDASDDFQMKRATLLHSEILRFTSKVNGVFRYVLLVQVICTIVQACVVIFAIIEIGDYIFIFLNLSPLVIACYTQLLLYCYFGQQMTTQIDSIFFATYNNEWYNSSTRVKKGLLLMATCQNRSVYISSFRSLNASLETFLKSLQESYTQYLVLKNIIIRNR